MQFKTDQWNLALHSNLPLISFFMHLTILSSFSTTPAWMIAFLCIEIYDGQWSHHSTKSFLQRGIQRTNGFLSSILNNPIVLYILFLVSRLLLKDIHPIPMKECVGIYRWNRTNFHHSTTLDVLLMSSKFAAHKNLSEAVVVHRALSSSFSSIKHSWLWMYARSSDLASF